MGFRVLGLGCRAHLHRPPKVGGARYACVDLLERRMCGCRKVESGQKEKSGQKVEIVTISGKVRSSRIESNVPTLHPTRPPAPIHVPSALMTNRNHMDALNCTEKGKRIVLRIDPSIPTMRPTHPPRAETGLQIEDLATR